MDQQELISTGVADIAGSLGLGADEPAGGADDAPIVEAAPDEAAAPADEAAPPVEGEEAQAAPEVTVRPPPKSWAKETHEVWAKLPPEAQTYIEKREQDILNGLNQYREHHTLGKSMNDVISPYRPMIQAAGIDDAKAVATLLNAHYRLTQGPLEQRRAVYEQLGRDLGFEPGTLSQQPQIPPEVQAALQRVDRLEGTIRQQQDREMAAMKQKVTSEFEAFAKDKPHIDEVSAEMVAFINSGDDLQTAYEKAVYANPATRAKEIARVQKEAEAKLKEKAKAEVGAAKKATAANVRGRDTGRTPTEPLGKIEDTMRETLREIASRTH